MNTYVKFLKTVCIWRSFKEQVGWLVGFYNISTLEVYLMPNPVYIYIYIYIYNL